MSKHVSCVFHPKPRVVLVFFKYKIVQCKINRSGCHRVVKCGCGVHGQSRVCIQVNDAKINLQNLTFIVTLYCLVYEQYFVCAGNQPRFNCVYAQKAVNLH